MAKNLVLVLLLLSIVFSSEIVSLDNLALTIYNDEYGIVKDSRTISIDTQQSYLSVEDVASTIQSQTVVFRVLSTNQKIKILEQNFQNNLIGKQGLLKKYLNKNVIVFTNLNSKQIVPVNGTLLGYSPSCILKTKNGLEIFDQINGMVLSDLPDGLLIQPSLVWKIKSPFNIKKQIQCQIDYRAKGFSWKADYNVIISEDEKSIDLVGWVTIDNKSGKKYNDAKVKLIAGQVNTIPKPRFIWRARYAMSKRSFRGGVGAGAPLVTEKTIGDYHMYTISHKITLNQQSIKQIQFIPKIQTIPIRKYYRISINTGGYSSQIITPQNIISFNNSKQNKVGMPLPKGDVKLLKLDPQDNSLQLLKQTTIKHSPKNQFIKIDSGTNSFITAHKKMLKERIIGIDGRWDSQTQLKIHNKFNKEVEIEFRLLNGYGDNLRVQLVSPDNLDFAQISSVQRRLILKLKQGQQQLVRWKQWYQRSI